MKTVAKIFSNKQCTMVIGSSEVKVLKTNRIACLDLEVDKNYKIEFFIQKEDVIEKTLKLSLTPDSACSAYIVSVDWRNENISCMKDNIDPTHIHLKRDVDNKCFIYDAKTFSLYHSIDAPYEYHGDFNEFGLALVKFHVGGGYHFGVIDKNLRIVIPLEYSDICIDKQGYILAHKYRHSYLFTTDGTLLFNRNDIIFFGVKNNSSSYTSSMICNDGLIKVIDPDTNEQGYINTKNEIVLDTKYYGIKRFKDNNSLFVINTAYTNGAGVIDVNNNNLLSFSYNDIIPVKQCSKDKYIYIVCNYRSNAVEKYYTIIDDNEKRIVDEEFEEFKYIDNKICLLREEIWHFYDRDLTLLATYVKGMVRIYPQWIVVNIDEHWLPFDKVVNYQNKNY